MMWVQLGGSLAAVLALAGVAWLLGLGGGELTEADAVASAEAERPGFRAAGATLRGDGRSATVRSDDGRTVSVRVHGARLVVEDADA